MIKYIFRGLVILISLLLTPLAVASLHCELNQVFTAITASVEGLPTLSATPDLPVGQVLFQGRINASYSGGNDSLSCEYDATDTGKIDLHIHVVPAVKGGTALDDHTFKTNIPGIGVQFWIIGGYITNTGGKSPAYIDLRDISPGWKNSNVGTSTLQRSMTFFLVKTGDITPGMVDGASFPKVEYTWVDNGSSVKPVGFPLPYVDFNFSGKVNVMVPSCTTPGDFSVALGSYDISEIKSNNTTPWKNVGLKLTNCPAFTGYSSSDSNWTITQPGSSSVGMGKLGDMISNKLGITLTPLSGAVDASQGTFHIDSSVTHSASGVALQVASGTTASQVPVNIGTRSEIALSRTDSPSTIDIPLVVRMVKTSDNPTPGNVVSKLTYLIDYK